MVKIKRVRTADMVVAAFRFGKEEGTVGSLILGLYDEAGELRIVGPHLGLQGQGEARADRACSSPIAPVSAARASPAAGSPTRSWSGRDCAPSWSARSPSITSPATGFVTERSSCAGGPTRIQRNARSRNYVPDARARAGHGGRARPGPVRGPAGQPLRRHARRPAGDLRLGNAQPLPLVLRPPDGRHVRSATWAGSTRRSPSSRAPRARARTWAGTASRAPRCSRAARPRTTSRPPTSIRAAPMW